MVLDYFLDNFLTALAEQYPRKVDLINALMNVLPLEKESIYRRLRKDVLFTSEEILKIASAWNISLDNIICANPGKIRPFRLSMIEYINPQESDYQLFEGYNQMLEVIGQDPNGRIIEITSTMPGSWYNRYDNLTRFFTMKWLYKYAMPETFVAFKDVQIPERMRALEREYVDRVRNIAEVYAIHDPRFIEHLISQIQYFRSIKFLMEEEVFLLRDELLDFISKMEDVTLKGYFPDTGKKYFLYMTHTWLDAEYYLYESKSIVMSMVRVLERNGITSFDKDVFRKFTNMFEVVKRLSVLFSVSNTLQRSEFFEKQKELILSLNN